MPTPTSDNTVSVLRFGPVTPHASAARVGHVDRDAMWWAVEETFRLGSVSSTGEIECGPDGLTVATAGRTAGSHAKIAPEWGSLTSRRVGR